MELDRAQFPHFSETQWGTLSKMQGILGPEGLAQLLTQSAEAQVSRVEQFISYENALMDHVRGALQQQTAPAPVAVHNSTKPLHLKVNAFSGDDSENLTLWFRELEMAMEAALLTDERLKVAFAVSHLGGRARNWALTRDSTVIGAFPSWEQLKHELRLTFLPPNVAYQTRSRFLASRQGKRDLVDYVQELRTLVAGMVADPLPETVLITVFMEGLKVGPARTQLFRTRVSTFEAAVRVALEEDYCHRQSRISASSASVMTTTEGPQPMELGSAEQRNTQVTCYACGRVGHMQRNCPSRNSRPQGRFNNRAQRGTNFGGPRNGNARPLDGRGRGREQGNACSQ
jgi:hypothetical protein